MEKQKNTKKYYIGLDIGTDSVGYAVTDENYNLLKNRGEPMWGVTVFDAAIQGQERRSFRTARRRLGRSAPWKAFLQTKSTRAMLDFRRPSPPTTSPRR